MSELAVVGGKKIAVLPPNGVIGIIGGGQLGRMIAIAAANLGFRTIVLEPMADCPAAQVCNGHIIADYDDETALGQLCEQCAVITYEFENVPLSAAEFVTERAVLFPPSKALAVSQDRLAEKQFLTDAGIPVADYVQIRDVGDLKEGLTSFGAGVLKTRRFGYDGKGQVVFKPQSPTDLESLESALAETGQAGEHGWVLESLVNFSGEFSMIGVRDQQGQVRCYPAATNIHEDGILRRSSIPCDLLGEDQEAEAKAHVAAILENLDYVGVIGVEFFKADQGIMVNEIAPRVHNTGHWTVEACFVGQFEQHVRVISGLAAGDCRMKVASCQMENLLGEEASDISAYLQDPRVTVTLYGKLEARAGRKMGHLTRLEP